MGTRQLTAGKLRPRSDMGRDAATRLSTTIGFCFGFIMVGIMCLTGNVQAEEGDTEFCQWETFQASCDRSDQVILINSGRYGRMNYSRCVRENHGNLGCYADVTSHLDRICSGRKRCHVTIPDAELHTVHPCPRELMPYLEASYSCVTVEMVPPDACVSDHCLVTSSTSGYLSSLVVTDSILVGTAPCPWKIVAQNGRRINLTLFDFFTPDSEATAVIRNDSPSCDNGWIIVVSENNMAVQIPGCPVSPPSAMRQRSIYLSHGNSVSVLLERRSWQSSGDVDQHILLNYQIFGCADMNPTKETFIRRVGDTTIVRCQHDVGDQTATRLFTCVNSQWVGENSTCSQAKTAGRSVSLYNKLTSNGKASNGLTVMVFIGVSSGMLAGCLFMLATMVYTRKRKQTAERKAPNRYVRQCVFDFTDDSATDTGHLQQAPQTITQLATERFQTVFHSDSARSPLNFCRFHRNLFEHQQYAGLRPERMPYVGNATASSLDDIASLTPRCSDPDSATNSEFFQVMPNFFDDSAKPTQKLTICSSMSSLFPLELRVSLPTSGRIV